MLSVLPVKIPDRLAVFAFGQVLGQLELLLLPRRYLTGPAKLGQP